MSNGITWPVGTLLFVLENMPEYIDADVLLWFQFIRRNTPYQFPAINYINSTIGNFWMDKLRLYINNARREPRGKNIRTITAVNAILTKNMLPNGVTSITLYSYEKADIFILPTNQPRYVSVYCTRSNRAWFRTELDSVTAYARFLNKLRHGIMELPDVRRFNP